MNGTPFPLYNILEVCLHSDKIQLNSIGELIDYSASVARDSSFERTFEKLDKEICFYYVKNRKF